MKTKEQKKLLKKCRHKAEIPFTVGAVLLTVLFVVLVIFLVKSVSDENSWAEEFLMNRLEFGEAEIHFAVKCGKYLLIVIVLVLALKLTWELFKNAGIAMVNDVPVEEDVCPEIFAEYRRHCETLGIKNVPKLLLASDTGNLEDTGIRLKSNRYLRLDLFSIGFSDSMTRFDIVHDLADIAYRHYDYPLLIATVVARWLPFVKNMYSRIMCYSSDRLAAELIGREECITALLREYMKAAYEEEKREEYIKHLERELTPAERVSAVLNNLSTDTPSYLYRLQALIKDDNRGRVI